MVKRSRSHHNHAIDLFERRLARDLSLLFYARFVVRPLRRRTVKENRLFTDSRASAASIGFEVASDSVSHEWTHACMNKTDDTSKKANAALTVICVF